MRIANEPTPNGDVRWRFCGVLKGSGLRGDEWFCNFLRHNVSVILEEKNEGSLAVKTNHEGDVGFGR